MAKTKYEYYDNENDADGTGSTSATQWLAQTFTPQISHTITSVDLFIYRVGTPDNVSVSIYDCDGDHEPDNLLCAVTQDMNSITTNTDAEWVNVDLGGGYPLVSGTEYAVVISDPGTGYIVWRIASAGTYTRGYCATTLTSGETWTVYGDVDRLFREYGGESFDTAPVDKTYSKQLVAVGSNQIWYESSAGTMSVLSSLDIDCSLPLNIFEAYSKAFIVNDTNLKIADLVNTKIQTDDIKDEVAGATLYPKHGTLITGAGGAEMVVDYITALDGAAIIYGMKVNTTAFVDGELVSGVNPDDSTVVKLDIKSGTTEIAGPHWYDWTVYGQSTTFGALPNKAIIGCLYRGRVVVSGNSQYPHQWYMMRQANPFDALYGLNDAQSAVAGNNADAGEIGDIVKALIPYKDDYLIFGCANTIWYLTGDPCDGGSINELDLTTGIFGAQSWCIDGEGNLWFWGTNGIYRAAIPGKPICVSEIRLPDLVGTEAVTQSTHRIVLSYDRRRAGIVINITTLADGTNSNYFYDLRTEGFFPESYPEECAVFSSHYYEAIDPDYRKLVQGSYDGYLRIFDETAEDDILGDDTGEAIDSYVTFAPIPMSPDPKLTGKLTGLNVISAGGSVSGSQTDSDDIYFEVYVANVAEQVLEKLSAGVNPNISGTIKAPGRHRGSSVKRKIKGIYAGIKIGNLTATETWAFEQLLYDMKQAGRFK